MEYHIQGDLMLIKVTDTPQQTGDVRNNVVLLEGEGHNVHTLERGIVSTYQEAEGSEWLRNAINELQLDAEPIFIITVPDETHVNHTPVSPDVADGHNHAPLFLPQGDYIAVQQRQTFPDVGVVKVLD